MTTLYKTAKTGSTQQWSIEVQGDSFICTYGQLNGKMQTQVTKCEPKNLGRANETSPEQQAVIEMEALIAKKLKSGYSYSSAETSTVQLPMKVKVYQDQLHNVKFPCYSSPKLNGVNATFTLVNDELLLTSRGGDPYPALPHLDQPIKSILAHLNTDRIAGELYIHGEHLQDISSYVKSTKPKSAQLEFHIFDLPNVTEEYTQRRTIMQSITPSKFIKVIPSIACDSFADIDAHFNASIKAGFEGIVIYNACAMYQYNFRSSDIFKYKVAQDAEFKVVSFTADKDGFPLLICETPTHKTFTVKPTGTADERTALLANLPSLIGQFYTVEFETYSKAGIPLKPVGIGFRKCSSNGEPLE